MIEYNTLQRLPLLRKLEDLAKSGVRLEASILTTYTFNGVFYEEVLLRAFERAGSRLNIVLVDAGQLRESFGDPLRRPDRAGADYLLVPVMHPGAFHPKIVALLSEKKALLTIGSHNATDAGFSHNEELTSFWGESQVPPPSVMSGAVEYALWWLRESAAVSTGVLQELEQRIRGLLPKTPEVGNGELSFIASSKAVPLWDRLRAQLSSAVSRVWIVGPYFDSKLAFLNTVQRELEPTEIIVGIQPTTALLPDPSLAPDTVRFVDSAAMGAFWRDADDVGFAHGKLIALKSVDYLVVSIGSANPTGAAWLNRPDGNAEANLCLTAAAATAAFANLGLSRLTNAPRLAPEELRAIADRSQEQRRRERAASESARPLVLTGDWREDGLLLVGELPRLPPDMLLQAPGGAMLPARVTPLESGAHLKLPERPTVGLHRLLSTNELLGFVLVNDTQALRAASVPRDRRRILEHLGSLDSNATFNELFDLLDRHVLASGESESATGLARSASPRADEGKLIDENAPFGPRGVSPEAEPGAERRQPRLKDGLISEIIAALLRALAAPPPPRTDGDAPDLDPDDSESAISAEDLATNLEAEPNAKPIDWLRLVTACRKRLSLMIDRLEERLEEAARGERTPEWALGRLLVVLCLLQRLRCHLPGGSEAPLNITTKPKSLVGIEHLNRAFSVALHALYGPGRLAEAIEISKETRAALEREQLDNVLFWFAREIGADWKVEGGAGLTEQVLQARADLIPVAMSAAAYRRLEVWAENRDPGLGIWDDSVSSPPSWSRRQLALGRQLQQRLMSLVAPMTALRAGDLVAWQSEPWVVKAVRGRNVDLLGPGDEARVVRGSALGRLELEPLVGS